MKEWKEIAEDKGYQVVKAFPSRLIIMEKATGKTVGTHTTIEEVEAALNKLKPSKVKKVVSEPVQWRTAAQPSAQPVKGCSQGYANCLCQEEELFLFCCASKDCENRAECLGACSFHFPSLKIFGDLTNYAAAKTEEMIAQNDEKECEHGIGYHSYEAAKARYEAGIRTNIILKGRSLRPTSGKSPTTDLGILGAIVRQVGSDWVVMDKDANILSKHPDRELLVKQFLFDD